MTHINEKKTVTIPVPASYLEDSPIAGVKKEDLRTMWFGEVELRVFFVEVPEDQAKTMLAFTWAEVNYDKPKRRRQKEGIIDCELDDDAENKIASSDDPLQWLVDLGAEDEAERIINYLEGVHKHYGEIFRERLNGNFNCEEIAKVIGKPKTTAWRWSNKLTKLAAEYYFKNNF